MAVKTRKEREKKAREATLGGSLILALISAAIGVSAGIWTFASNPVVEVRDMPPPDQRQPGVVYLVRGSDQASVGYRPKLDMLLAGRPGTYAFSEKELNTWARDTFRFTTAGNNDGSGIRITPSTPNFRLTEDGVVQIAMNTEISAWGSSRKMWYQVRGEFNEDNGYSHFQAEETFLGSAKIPPLGVATMLNSMILGMFTGTTETEKLMNIWSRVDSVRVENSTLVFEIR